MPRCDRCTTGLMVLDRDADPRVGDFFFRCLNCGIEDYGQPTVPAPVLRSTKHNAGPTERSQAIRRMIRKGTPLTEIARAFDLTLGSIQHHAAAVRLDRAEGVV